MAKDQASPNNNSDYLDEVNYRDSVFDEDTSEKKPSSKSNKSKNRSNSNQDYLDETSHYESSFDDSLVDEEFGTINNQDLEITLISWVGPSHIRKVASRRYYFNMALIVVIIAIILIFLQQLYLMMIILAIVFLFVVSAISPAQPVRHTITNYGIYSGNKFYPWENSGRFFWFETDDANHRSLIVQTRRFPWSVIMLLNKKINEDRLTEILNNFITYRTPKRNWMDKIITWFKKTFPLDW